MEEKILYRKLGIGSEECGHPIDLGIAAVLQQPNEGTSTQTCNAAR